MSIKVCSTCQTKNAAANTACIKCGKSLIQVALSTDKKKKNGNLYMEIAGKFFSFLLMICAILSVAMATLAVMNVKNPDFSIFSIYKTIEE